MSFFDTMLRNVAVEMLRDIAQNCALPDHLAASVDVVAQLLLTKDASVVSDCMGALFETNGAPHDAMFTAIFVCADTPRSEASETTKRVVVDLLSTLSDEHRTTIDRYVRQMRIIHDNSNR